MTPRRPRASRRPATPRARQPADEPVAAPAADGLVRVRLDLGYDGAPFSGWARQPARRTVQGELEDALGKVLGAPVSLTVAGRTDAGVHATGQVAHFDAPVSVEPTEIVRRVNRALDDSIRVYAAQQVPSTFDARFSALWRRYSYRVADATSAQGPLRRHDTVWHPRALSLRAMRLASKPLVGEHDFVAF
ncbi:MAG: tRNA pseudouridine(38-40) synthase TruA, partial [Mycobacteriales bacterium]